MVTPFWKQTWAVSAVLINMVAQGMLLSYTSSLLPALQDPRSPLKTDIETASWISSSIGLSGIFGFFISAILMDVLGRRLSHILVIVPGAVGWLMICYANNVSTVMIGRILGGLTAGATVSLGAIIIGEYTSPIYRGMFLNLKTTAVCLGGMIVHILTNFYSWRTIAMISVLPYAVAIMITFTWPESPSWYAERQEFEKCEQSFYWLRGKNEDSYKELEELIQARMGIVNKQSLEVKAVEFFKKFTRKDFLKPVSISILGGLLLETSGRHIFPAYALSIISEITGSKTNSFIYTLCIDLIIVFSTLFSSVLVRMAKRRTLLFSTGFASVLVLLLVCLYLFMESKEIISRDYNLIPISMFVMYFILVNLGCTPIPLAFLGEIFPLAHRGAGSAMTGMVMSTFVMLGLKLTPILMIELKVYGTFAVFGVISTITLIILYFILPETKDKTLQEIEDHFNGRDYKNKIREEDKEVTVKMIKA